MFQLDGSLELRIAGQLEAIIVMCMTIVFCMSMQGNWNKTSSASKKSSDIGFQRKQATHKSEKQATHEYVALCQRKVTSCRSHSSILKQPSIYVICSGRKDKFGKL